MISPQIKRILSIKRCGNLIQQKATFWGWLNNVHNHYNEIRIEEAGADRAAAEWLLRNGASIKWRGRDYYVKDYNELAGGREKKIQEIIGIESSISHVGFPYLKNLEYVEKFVVKRNPWFENQALILLGQLEPIRNTLIHLEIVSCGNITDAGIKSLVNVPNLETLILADLPYVKNKDECINVLKSALDRCDVVWPEVEYSTVGKKTSFMESIFGK